MASVISNYPDRRGHALYGMINIETILGVILLSLIVTFPFMIYLATKKYEKYHFLIPAIFTLMSILYVIGGILSLHLFMFIVYVLGSVFIGVYSILKIVERKDIYLSHNYLKGYYIFMILTFLGGHIYKYFFEDDFARKLIEFKLFTMIVVIINIALMIYAYRNHFKKIYLISLCFVILQPFIMYFGSKDGYHGLSAVSLTKLAYLESISEPLSSYLIKNFVIVASVYLLIFGGFGIYLLKDKSSKTL